MSDQDDTLYRQLIEAGLHDARPSDELRRRVLAESIKTLEQAHRQIDDASGATSPAQPSVRRVPDVPTDSAGEVHRGAHRFSQHPSRRHAHGRFVAMLRRRSVQWMAAAAAVVVLAVLGLWPTSGGGAGAAFAAVVRPLLTAHTATYTLTTLVGETPTRAVKGMFMDPGRTRLTLPDGEVVVIDIGQGKMMNLLPARKVAKVIEWGGKPTESQLQRRGNPFHEIRRRIREVQESSNQSVELLGERQFGATTAVGYRVSRADGVIAVWADRQTDLPIRLEFSTDKEMVIISDIAFNAELDESLFALRAPEGYSLIEESAPAGCIITGTVKDAGTGQPIAGARVSDDRYGPKPYRGASTDSTGKYRYDTWPEEHRIVAQAPGYKAQRQTLSTGYYQDQKEVVMDFALVRE